MHQQSRCPQTIARDDGYLANASLFESEYDRPRCTPRPDNDGMFTRPVGVGNRCKKTGCIGVGSDQAAIFLPNDCVHRPDLLAHASRIGDQIEHGYFMWYRNIATAPIRIHAPFFDIGGQIIRCDMAGAVIRLYIEPFEPEFVDQWRFAVGNRVADHLGIGNICGHVGKIPRMRR